MNINWFPGHMTKALRELKAEIKNIDAIIYVLDARAPLASLNPELDKITENKPVLFILNKIDLADKSKMQAVIESLKNRFYSAEVLTMNATASGALKSVLNCLNKLCKVKIDKNKAKGIVASVRAMVVGVPNSGKSTLVNNLCGKAKAITGNKPGVTRGKQWVTVATGFQILDTPGTLYPKLDNEKTARKLAYIGSIRDEVLDRNELALMFVGDIIKVYPNALKNRYGIEETGTALEILESL